MIVSNYMENEIHSNFAQYDRPWKLVNYVITRAALEMRHELDSLDLDDEEKASRGSFNRVCEYIRYRYPSAKIRQQLKQGEP